MRQLFGLLSSALVVMLVGSYAWTHRGNVSLIAATTVAAAAEPARPHVEYAEEAAARGMVTLTGPLANYIKDQPPGQDATSDSTNSAPSGPRPTVASDYAADSPVGTSTPLLHKTFTVAQAVNLPFEIPAHAASPKLHGTYSSFLQYAGARGDDEAHIEFMVLNEQQYADLIHRHPNDALFSADGSHDQEVNFTLPPTLSQPVRYYLVFRNDSAAGTGKIAVKADFRIDF
jgi:hypothetical protein